MVLTALKDAGLLTPIPGVDGQMRRRRVDLHVNAGIVLKGSRNTVCTGMPKLMKSTVTGPDAKEKTEAEKDECAMTTGETQKRRACSVSVLYPAYSLMYVSELTHTTGATGGSVSEESSLLLRYRPTIYVIAYEITSLATILSHYPPVLHIIGPPMLWSMTSCQ